jgi:NADPH2:quinone reductase
MRAMQASHYGGVDTIHEQALELGEPAANEALVRVEIAGVNYIDIYQRSGLYPTQEPVRLGVEGTGVIEAVGSDVRELSPGDRVAWVDTPGSYASHVRVPAAKLVRVPAGVTAAQATAAMLQGMTAHYLVHDTYRLRPGDTCLIHAAAGGVGLLVCQLARRLGARVIGTASTPEKAALARAAGAHEVILYTQEDFKAALRAHTNGLGVQVVYDSVGKATWQSSLESLAPRGMLVLFGNASGPVPPIDPLLLSRGGSLFLTRPTLFHYVSTRAELEQRAGAVFELVARGELSLRIDRVLPLSAAGRAHELLESRTTSGKLLLDPA